MSVTQAEGGSACATIFTSSLALAVSSAEPKSKKMRKSSAGCAARA
ncbi:MAG TPA: hypothetical protein VG475_00220 [Pseudolabrys sp.]|nr:hypothetical protein [Pseudolabrys sp.]